LFVQMKSGQSMGN